jgi:phosphoadenosine phosphosulfate reductase
MKDSFLELNKKLEISTLDEVLKWAISNSKKPVITTNFGPYSAALLHAVTRVLPNIPVIWCDSGYNTRETYQFAKRTTDLLDLNLKIYTPKHTVAYREAIIGIPESSHPDFSRFVQDVKLEPIRRAFDEFQPDLWFTNIRRSQTEFRAELSILSRSAKDVLKISPFAYLEDAEMSKYLVTHNLENEFRYFDPTKISNKSECGLHLSL